LKGGIPGGGGGGGNFTYSFQGDPHAMFAEFFGGRNPFEQFFGRNGGMDEDMETDDPFASFGMGGMGGMGGFSRSFNTRGHGGRVEKKQDPPVTHDLKVSLDEVLTGCTKKMKISRKRLNPDGRTTRTEDKILTVEVKKGWKEGTKITFPREGDETPTNIPADVVFVVKDKPHPVYKRDGSDIIYPAKITLREALCGCSINVPKLDGRTINLTSQEIIRPGMKRRVSGEDRRGDLVVEYEVSAKDTIANVLPAS
ncbi:hypothetical protein M9458_000583, partial [Cirrhinus mrigala]